MNSNPLIFIVEDDKAYNRLIEINLKKNDYNNIKCFFNGEDCIKNFNLKPDIIILDYYFTNSNQNCLNGFQVLDKIINGILRDPKVIMLSGIMHQDAQKVIDAKFDKGIFRYIVKSKDGMNSLIKAIDELT